MTNDKSGNNAGPKANRRMLRLGVELGPLLSPRGSHKPEVVLKMESDARLRSSKERAKRRFNRQFRERIKAARLAAGYDQESLGKRLGLRPEEYKQYESTRLLPHHLLPRLCRVLNVDLARLFAEESDESP